MITFLKFFTLLVLTLSPLAAAPPITAKDADGVERTLNQVGQVTVIVSSNPSVQERTRQAGKAMDAFQGRTDFRSIVLVDLRGTMADWAKGYTLRRMMKDLDQEALRITPAYRKNGNSGNPRLAVSAVADFDGTVGLRLGWLKPKNQLRVIIFDRNGKRFREWEDLKNLSELTSALQKCFP